VKERFAHPTAQRRITRLALIFLVIEFLDELVYGAMEAAWPLIRNELGLTYTQVGLAMSLPVFASLVFEPLLGILGDTRHRRKVILSGGVVFVIALGLTALAPNFLLFALMVSLLQLASGAFVSLSQSTLMDIDSERQEHNMARWTFAGSIGVALGPLYLGLCILLGWGWRGMVWGLAFFSLAVCVLAFLNLPKRLPAEEKATEPVSLRSSASRAIAALRKKEVLRWLILLEFSDLLLDVLYSYLALYLVDVAGLTPAQATLGVAVWTGVGLAGDFLLIPLLERVRGLDYLRVSVIIEMVLYPLFLLVPLIWVKFVILGLLGLFNAGWYSILRGNLYKELPGQSGSVLLLDNAISLVAGLIPLGIGWAAQTWGLHNAMWLLLAGPLALLIGLPRGRGASPAEPA